MVPYFGVALMGSYYLGSYNRVRYFRKPSNDIGTVVAGSIAGVVLIPEGMAYPFERPHSLGPGAGGGRGVGGWRAGKTSFALFCVFPCLAFLFTDTEGMGRSGQGGCGGDSSVIKGLQRTLIRYAHNCRVLTLPFCAFASCWSHYRGLNSVVVLGLRSRGCNLYRSRSFDSLLLLLL